MKKTLKVGFDLDGVILYNPIRIFRIFAKKILKPLKVILLKQEKTLFYLPQSNLEKFVWRIIHFTSFKTNTGFEDLKQFALNKNIKLYLITSRYDFLKEDYFYWLKKINAEKIFIQCYYNKNNLQPNEFKEKMIKKLKLDIYVEDNWDIIEKLNHLTQAKIFWIINVVDKNIPYQFKFYSLKEVCQQLEKLV